MNGMALCSGIGGLSLALEIAIPGFRDICHLEREAPAAAVLVEKMESGLMAPAPVWDDLATFDGRRWRGLVDILHGGLPCQPYSVAGQRKGDADERYLWPHFFRILGEVRATMVFLENVPGLLAWFRPAGEELCRMGYTIEVGLFSAAECGASQKRERVFILAHRECAGWRTEARSEVCGDEGKDTERESASRTGECGGILGNAERSRRETSGSRRQVDPGREPEPGCVVVAGSGSAGYQGDELGNASGDKGGAGNIWTSFRMSLCISSSLSTRTQRP